MVAPVFKWYEDDDITELETATNPLNFGSIDPGMTGTPVQVNLWNNKDGVSPVSTMEDVRLTTVTKNGYVTGDSGPAGSEGAYGRYVVEEAYINVKSVTLAETLFTPIGGAVTKTLDNIMGSLLPAPEIVTGEPDESEDGLMANGTYYYVVSAVDSTGETLKSDESDPVVISGANNQVVLSWDEVEGATSYKIFRTTTSGTYGASSYIGTVAGGTFTYTDLALNTSTGQPLSTATVDYGHKHEVEFVPIVPTDAEDGATEFRLRVLYKYI